MEDIRHKISVVLPIYNESVEMVSEALNSIQKQSFSDIEILVILDNPMNYNLIDYMTPLENLKIVNPKADKTILNELGLKDDEIKRNVLKLSGGQQQRVAIARTLVANSPVILADEPTGNLDQKNSKEIIDMLKLSNRNLEQTIVLITHDEKVALEADRIITIEDGMIKSDERRR